MPLMYTWKTIEEIKYRMEPAFWNPKYATVLEELQNSGFSIKFLGDYVTEITNGSRERAVFKPQGVKYIKAIDIISTGIVYYDLNCIEEGSVVDSPRSRLEINDLLIVRSGKGSIGKVAIWHKEMGKASSSQHVNLVRVLGINPYWVAAFLKSKFGQLQIEKLETGVSRMTHLNYEDIRRFVIPVVPENIQQSTERRYRQMTQFHDAAMEAKAVGDENEFREKLAYAEKLLAELIEYLEKTIILGSQAAESIKGGS